jgi:citrate synthase
LRGLGRVGDLGCLPGSRCAAPWLIPTGQREKALHLLATLPTDVALIARHRHGLGPILPRPDLDYAENFFHMCFGEIPDPEVVRAFEISMVLFAEHSFRASTFAARVVTSTMSDLHSAVAAAVGA